MDIMYNESKILAYTIPCVYIFFVPILENLLSITVLDPWSHDCITIILNVWLSNMLFIDIRVFFCIIALMWLNTAGRPWW